MKLLNILQHIETIPESFREVLKKEKFSSVVVSIFRDTFPEILDLFKHAFEARERNLYYSIDIQHTKKGKLKAIEKEIKKIQKVLNNDMVKERFLPMLDMTFFSILEEIKTEVKFIELLGLEDDDLIKLLESLFEKIEKAYLSDSLTDEENLSLLSEFEAFWSKLPTQQIPEILKKRTKKETDDMFFILRQFYTMIVFFHFEKEFLKYLKNKYNNIKQIRKHDAVPNNQISKNLKKLPTKNEPLPEGWTKIQLTISEKKEREFLSFLYKEKNGTDSGFLSENDFNELSKYGLSIPPTPTGKYYKLNLERRKKTVAMIFYSFYSLNGKLKSVTEKENLAKYLKYYFEDFKEFDVEEIKKKMRGRKPKSMKFDIHTYLN